LTSVPSLPIGCATANAAPISPASRCVFCPTATETSGLMTFITRRITTQYIRFNGSLIGGLAGLALYTIELLLRLL
jgi:hypothetical protein